MRTGRNFHVKYLLMFVLLLCLLPAPSLARLVFYGQR